MTMGVISRTCSWRRNTVPVPPRDPNHGRLLRATADPGKPRTRNDSTFLPPENDPNSDKPDRKKKKSNQKETPSKATSKKESAQDKVTWRVREKVVHKFREEEENQERESRPKKPKKKESSLWKETSADWDSSEEDERHNQKKKEKDAKAWEARETEHWAEEWRKEKAEDM